MSKETIGKIIHEFRYKKNMTISELSDKLQVSEDTISQWEMDQTMPEESDLMKLADILEVPLESLLSKTTIEGSQPEREEEIPETKASDTTEEKTGETAPAKTDNPTEEAALPNQAGQNIQAKPKATRTDLIARTLTLVITVVLLVLVIMRKITFSFAVMVMGINLILYGLIFMKNE